MNCDVVSSDGDDISDPVCIVALVDDEGEGILDDTEVDPSNDVTAENIGKSYLAKYLQLNSI